MKNKILLVDDEKSFLKNLQVSLAELEDIFKTDICFSVSEAIKLIETSAYDLIITEIRMPDKSGIDLLLYLKKNDFPGCIKLMSALSNGEEIEKIKSLGIIDIIPKPLNLELFENMLIDFFKKDKSVSFECKSLFTIMQVINLEKQDAYVQVDVNGKQGVIYFRKGEIVNAEYDGLVCEKAILELILLDNGNISVKNVNHKVKKMISTPFIELVGNFKKVIEKNSPKGKKSNKKNNLRENKESKMARMKDVLTKLNNEVSGLQVASIFGRDGIPIAMVNPANADIDAFAAKFAIAGTVVSKTAKDLSRGKVSEILVEEEKGWTLLRPIGKLGLFLLIAVTSEATLGNLRLVAKQLATEVEKSA